MKAILTNFGTTGDIQPFLALALEMKRHGHHPLLAFASHFRDRVSGLGLDFISIGPDLLEAQKEINSAMMSMPESSEEVRALFSPLVAALPQMYGELSDACASMDVIISGPAQPAGRMVHEVMGIPFVSVQLSHFGGIGSPSLREASAGLINPFREKLGLGALANPLTIDANSPQLALYAVSRHVMPMPVDWPSHHHMTGYFFLDEEEWEPDKELSDFISGGDPPVVFTFGSMPHKNPYTVVDILLEAISRIECRAIIQWDRNEIGERILPSNVLVIGYAPHLWLFRRSRCIVHHGGGGTAHSVFRSGVPSIFVPHGHIFDQYYWARLAHEMGCAAEPIPYSELNADGLVRALNEIAMNPDFSKRAAALGRKVGAENGVTAARQLVEQLLDRVTFCPTRGSIHTYGDQGYQARASKLARRKQYQQEQRYKKKASGDTCVNPLTHTKAIIM